MNASKGIHGLSGTSVPKPSSNTHGSNNLRLNICFLYIVYICSSWFKLFSYSVLSVGLNRLGCNVSKLFLPRDWLDCSGFWCQPAQTEIEIFEDFVRNHSGKICTNSIGNEMPVWKQRIEASSILHSHQTKCDSINSMQPCKPQQHIPLRCMINNF